jgi:hypothetical protein
MDKAAFREDLSARGAVSPTPYFGRRQTWNAEVRGVDGLRPSM